MFHKCYWNELSVECYLLEFSSVDIGIIFFLNSPEHTNMVSQEHILSFFFPTKHSMVWPCDPFSSQCESLQYPYYHNNKTFFIRLVYLPLVMAGSLGALSRWRRVGFYVIPDSHCVQRLSFLPPSFTAVEVGCSAAIWCCLLWELTFHNSNSNIVVFDWSPSSLPPQQPQANQWCHWSGHLEWYLSLTQPSSTST